MDVTQAVEFGREAILLGLKLALPLLAVSFAVGLIVNVFQAATQLHDQTISLVPRMLLTAVVALLLLPWALSQLVDYSVQLITNIPGG